MTDQLRSGGSPPTDTLDDRSVGDLLSAITSDLSTLLRNEVALAKAEVRQSAKKAGMGAGLLGGSGVAAHMVLLFLSLAAWVGIAHVTGNGWAALIVAVAWAVIAAVLYSVGRSKISSIEGLQQTAETAKQIPPALAGNEETA